MNAFRYEARRKDRGMGEVLTCICNRVSQADAIEDGEIVDFHHGGVQIGLECIPDSDVMCLHRTTICHFWTPHSVRSESWPLGFSQRLLNHGIVIIPNVHLIELHSICENIPMHLEHVPAPP